MCRRLFCLKGFDDELCNQRKSAGRQSAPGSLRRDCPLRSNEKVLGEGSHCRIRRTAGRGLVLFSWTTRLANGIGADHHGPLVQAMNETLEMLASKEHHDTWSARRQSRADGQDVELRFHPEHLEDRLGD